MIVMKLLMATTINIERVQLSCIHFLKVGGRSSKMWKNIVIAVFSASLVFATTKGNISFRKK